MANNTPRMGFPYPEKDEDPWFDNFEGFVEAVDASSYAAREDRQLIISSAASFTFDATSGLLSWTGPIVLENTFTGFALTIPAGNVTIADGRIAYLVLTRNLLSNLNVSLVVADIVPNTNDALVFCLRRGTSVYFLRGGSIADGETLNPFAAASSSIGASGEKFVGIVGIGARATNPSATPLVVGAIEFDPTVYSLTGTTLSLVFRAIGAIGNPGLTAHAKLYNVTDAEDVATVDFTATSTSSQELALTIGVAAGNIKSGSRIYEVQIWVDSPINPGDTAELYSATLRVINTIT